MQYRVYHIYIFYNRGHMNEIETQKKIDEDSYVYG